MNKALDKIAAYAILVWSSFCGECSQESAMPKVDALLKMLFENDVAVADVFNAVFGEGRRLITLCSFRRKFLRKSSMAWRKF